MNRRGRRAQDAVDTKATRAREKELKARGLPIVGQAHSRRECGTCSACCTHLTVEAGDPVVDHVRGHDCNLLAPAREDGKRLCGSYGTRPGACQKFECLWLQGFEGAEMRPDLVGFIMRTVLIERDGKRHAMGALDEIRAGALDTDIGRHTIAVMGSQVPTTITFLDGSQRLAVPPSMAALLGGELAATEALAADPTPA